MPHSPACAEVDGDLDRRTIRQMDTHGMELLASLERAFGSIPVATRVEALPGGCSTRRYYRVRFPEPHEPRTALVMRLPDDALGSDEITDGSRPTELPFVAVQRLLEKKQIRVPRIFDVDLPNSIVLLEDLGDETFEDRLGRRAREDWPSLYGQAIDLLADLHSRCESLGDESTVEARRFDRALLRWELDHFREWGLETLHGTLAAEERAGFDADFDRLADAIAAMPTGFVHRDYQSRNLMWKEEALVVIDFQDALIGPRAYDLVALLCDSYVAIDEALQLSMLDRYARRRGHDDEGRRTLEREFFTIAVQRKLKDAGRFVFMDRERGNPAFLRWYPGSLEYVGRALRRLPEWATLAERLSRLLPGFPDRTNVPASVHSD